MSRDISTTLKELIMSKLLSRLMMTGLFLVALSSCSNFVPTSLKVDQIVTSVRKADLTDLGQNHDRSVVKFSIAKVTDVRPSQEIGRTEQYGPISASGNIEREVRQAIERTLRAHSFVRSSFDGPFINVQVQDWFVDLKMDFPSSVAKARAKLFVEVSDESGLRVFSGNYEGRSEVQHPLIKTQAEQALGQAMALAIEELALDSKLRLSLKKLTSLKSEGAREASSEQANVNSAQDNSEGSEEQVFFDPTIRRF